MPIITTPGQPTQPVPKQDAATTLPPRLQSAFTPTNVQPIVPLQQPTQPVAQHTIDDSTDDFSIIDDSDDDDGFGAPPPVASSAKTGVALSRMSEEDRRNAITSAFALVLGKIPSDRDYSYYRFSTLIEDALIKSLLNLPEHKKLVEKAKEHASLKQSVSDLDLQVKQLDSSMQSMKQELATMQDLLVEKNRYIQQMRGLSPETVTSNLKPPLPEVSSAAVPSHSFPVPQPAPKVEAPMVETRKLPGPMDEIKSIFKGVFGGK